MDNKTTINADDVDKLLTEKEAAKLLSCPAFTLAGVRNRGEINFLRIGKAKVLYTRQHPADFLNPQVNRQHSLQNLKGRKGNK